MSLKPLTRAHRTIQHFSKNTHPQHKTKRPLPAAVSPREAKRPRMACLVLYWFGRPHIPQRTQRTPARPRTLTQRPNRTVLFNIASILCLSMLFSKNSEVLPPKAFEKNTSSTPHNTVPVSPGFSMITHLISLAFHQAVLFNVARFSTLSSHFRKIFRFFFRFGPDSADSRSNAVPF